MDTAFEDELERRKLDALAEFAAGAGHEINNPLAIISGHAQRLLREVENPEHRRLLAIIAAQVKRTYEMIADIRLFARPPKPEIRRFDLVADLRRLVAEQTPFFQEAGLSLEFSSDQDEREIESDPVQIHIVVAALCDNAREAGGNTVIRLSGTEIIVEDDGPGIPVEIRSLVFAPYFSGRQAGRGLGFGLPKAWRIMQQLGGSLRLETGSGVRAVVSLTAAASETRGAS
jgi:signal transduction histidine kinase